MKAMEDRGTLSISPGKLMFEGQKGKVEVTNGLLRAIEEAVRTAAS